MSPSTSTDVRYGRRGGRWANPTQRRPKRTVGPPCAACSMPTHWEDDWPDPICCGRLLCRARLTWDIDRWNGAARLARSRQRLGIELTPLDQHALDLTENHQ